MILQRLTPDYTGLRNRTVFFVVGSLSILIRFPFFFRDYIDRDESTFILMGQSWVEGHLPYTELWDLKPPITFLFFAGIIYVFGKSFLAIRLGGALLVAITAFFTYKIGASLDSKKVGYWSALLCVVLQSMFGSIQGVMSEHLCMAFFVPGLYLPLQGKKSGFYGVAGLLMGLAVMTKLNIAYAVLAVGLYLLFEQVKNRGYTKGTIQPLLFGSGILSVIMLTFLPYYLEGSADIWWNSVVLASMEYATIQRSTFSSFAPILLGVVIFLVIAWKLHFLNLKDRRIQLLLVAIFGVLLSFFKAGRINSHYLIQLYPLLLVLVVIFISRISIFKRFDYRPFAMLLCLALPIESFLEYGAILKNKWERGTFFNGEGITVPQYLIAHHLETKNVLFFEYHIGYWLLDAMPPTKAATHPSNICRIELFPYFDNPRISAIEELRYILSVVRPQIVVTRKDRLIFDENLVAENRFVQAYLNQHYKSLSTVDQAQIYQRLE